MAMSLALHNVSFVLNNGHTLFHSISFGLKHRINALVGINGVGKSVLAQIISKQLQPSEGNVSGKEHIAFVAQQWPGKQEDSVLAVLGLQRPLEAIARIENNVANDDDFELAEPWWDWQTKLNTALLVTGLALDLDVQRPISSFSGGEQFRIGWAAAILTQADLYVLDEPTNHLDSMGKTQLLNWIKTSSRTFFIVSHDRQLLREVDAIYELTPSQLHYHPGGYDSYFEAKQQRWKSQIETLAEARKMEKRAAVKAQESLEKQQQRVSNSRARAEKENWCTLVKNGAKEAGENNLRKQNTMRNLRASSTESERLSAEQEREWFDPIGFELPQSVISTNKRVLTFTDFTVGYNAPLTHPTTANLRGPFRLHITGPNGSGKSAFVKTLLGDIPSTSGECKTQVLTAYLDQHFLQFDFNESALGNVLLHQPELTEKEARDRLAWLRLRNTKAEIPFGKLSGGEQLKVALVSKLLGKNTPQLLILDEPTNHLDLDSLMALEKALDEFKGAMIIISHDEAFTSKQRISHTLNLPKGDIVRIYN
jgi:ATPase subunit of ABC transporter with duplicated ATPase domains